MAISYLIKKILAYRDYETFYHIHEFSQEKEVPFSFVAGEFQSLIPEDMISGHKLIKQDKPLFPKDNILNMTVDVGENGVCFLELRKGYIFNNIKTSPRELGLDIFYGPEDRLIYSFYNITKISNIVLSGKIEKDLGGILKSIKDDPTNLLLRDKLASNSRTRWEEKYRYEWIYRITLPVNYNNNKPIPHSKFRMTKEDLLKIAGGLTMDDLAHPHDGYWLDEQGKEIHDKVIFITVGTKSNQNQFFSDYKNTLKANFKQKDIRIEGPEGIIF